MVENSVAVREVQITGRLVLMYRQEMDPLGLRELCLATSRERSEVSRPIADSAPSISSKIGVVDPGSASEIHR